MKLRLVTRLKLPTRFLGTDWADLYLQNSPIETNPGYVHTLVPDLSIFDYLTIVDNQPTRKELLRKVHVSEVKLWESLGLVRTYMDVYTALQSCAAKLQGVS